MSYLIHFNPNHDKLGRFTSGPESKIKNYMRVMDSLTPEEFKFFTDGETYDKEKESKWVKDYVKYQKMHEDTRVFISKYGNITMASLETNGLGNQEWNIGWATDPKARGTGVTQSNIKEAMSFIRKYSDLPISATIDPSNIPSRKTAEKAGFKDVGFTRMNDGSVMKRYVHD